MPLSEDLDSLYKVQKPYEISCIWTRLLLVQGHTTSPAFTLVTDLSVSTTIPAKSLPLTQDSEGMPKL